MTSAKADDESVLSHAEEDNEGIGLKPEGQKDRKDIMFSISVQYHMSIAVFKEN